MPACKSCAAFIEDAEVEQRNVGSYITARKLLEIAKTGEHAGVFGGEVLEQAAQSILALHRKIADLQKELERVDVEGFVRR